MGNYNNMKIIREMYGITQEELAKAIETNRASISLWENGKVIASSAILEKLAMYYGINPNSFYDMPDVEDIRKTFSMKKQQEYQYKANNPVLYKRETVKDYKDGQLTKKTVTEYFN